MNPVFQFLYANMNYHIEHHMFPMVPFYRLPELHAMIKDQCPPAFRACGRLTGTSFRRSSAAQGPHLVRDPASAKGRRPWRLPLRNKRTGYASLGESIIKSARP